MAALAAYRAQIANLTRSQTLTINVRRDDPNPTLPSGGGGSATAAAGSAASVGTNPYVIAAAAVAGLTLLPALGALVPMLLGFAGAGGAAALASKDMKEELKKLKPELDGLKKTASKAIMPSLKGSMKDLRGALKDLNPVVKDGGRSFGIFTQDLAKFANSPAFGSALRTNVKMGGEFFNGFTRDLLKFTQSFMDFGTKSKPTMDAFQNLLGGLLSKGLPGMFQGLERGIGGSAKMLDGLASALNDSVLPALGRLAGDMADVLGPVFGKLLENVGRGSALMMDSVGAILRVLKPVFKEIGYGLDIITYAWEIMGPTMKEAGLQILNAFAPISSEVGKIQGPLQRMMGWLNNNKVTMLEAARVFGVATIDMVRAAVESAPFIIGAFKLASEGVLTAIGGIVSGAEAAFGWIPGIGDDFKNAKTDFDGFKNNFINGLTSAQGKAQEFKDYIVPRLNQGELRLNITNWESQIREAKLLLSDKNLPKEKRAELKATIKDLQDKIAQAKTALDSVPDTKSEIRGNLTDLNEKLSDAKKRLATVPDSRKAGVRAEISQLQAKIREAKRLLAELDGKTATTHVVTTYIKRTQYDNDGNGVPDMVQAPRSATGGLVRGYASGGSVMAYPFGGSVFGPGTGTSDSIPTWLSNGEYVIRAKSVAKYGLAFMNTLNQGTLGMGRMASGGLAGSEVANGLASGMQGGTSKVNSAARTMAAAVEAGVRTELQIASPSKKMQELAKDIGAGLIKGLTGSRDQIKSTSASLAKSIWDTFSGSTDNRLVGMLNQQTKKLLDLAAKRDKLAASLAAGQQMAKDQKASGLSFASLTSLPNGGNTFDAGGILSGLKVRLGQLNAFSGNIAKLAKMGLSKDLIGQLIAAGPEGGAAYAAALVKATPDQLKALNSTQSQIAKASSSYGNSAADIMYDAGSQAGKGFLTGLTAQKKSIENAMSSLAKAIQAAIKKALKIKSPSRVMAEIGQHVGEGLVMGMDATHATVAQSARRMGSMATQVDAGISNYRPSPERSPDVHFHTNSVTDKPTRETVMYALRDYSALNPLVA